MCFLFKYDTWIKENCLPAIKIISVILASVYKQKANQEAVQMEADLYNR